MWLMPVIKFLYDIKEEALRDIKAKYLERIQIDKYIPLKNGNETETKVYKHAPEYVISFHNVSVHFPFKGVEEMETQIYTFMT